MAYHMSWYVDGQIIFTRLWGEQTHEDGNSVNQSLISLMDSSQSQHVYVIVESSGLKKSPPPNMSVLSSTFSAFRHPKFSWFIAIGNVSTVNSIMGIMLGQLFNIKYRKLSDFDQAITFIKDRDTTINWSLADLSVLELDS